MVNYLACRNVSLVFGFLVAAQAQTDESSFMQTYARIREDQPPEQQAENSVHMINGLPVYGYDRASHQSPTTWIVSFSNFATDQTLDSFCKKFDSINGSQCEYAGHMDAVPVVIVTTSEQDLTTVPTSAAAYIEVDGDTRLIAPKVREDPTEKQQKELHWGLDRINDRLGLNDEESTQALGSGINIYSLDTGINVRNPDFEGRAKPLVDFTQYNFYTKKHYIVCKTTDTTCATDVQGHGTHTAGIAVSKTYGVAKGATVWAAKVLSDNGAGKWSWLLGAMDWVVTMVKAEGINQAVITASLGGMGPEAAVKQAINRCNRAGISVIVAAGNDADDACKFLPSSVPAAITVGSTDEYDVRSYFSNYGKCVDLFAPGSNIVSLNSGFGGPVMMSGTSMSTPFVAGAAALALGQNPKLTPAGVMDYLRRTSTTGCITDLPDDTPNLLLYTGPETADTSCKAPEGQLESQGQMMKQQIRFKPPAWFRPPMWQSPMKR